MTTQTEIESTTVTVEIHHADFGADATADVRCFGLDELTQDVFDEHYESLGEPVEIDSGVLDAGEPVLAIEILEDVWRRTQGGRNDDELPYDGSQVRSSCVGDVVVLDGVPFAAADVGFERVELDVEDGPEIVTDGGVGPNPLDAYDGQQSGDEFRCKDCAAMRDHNCQGWQKEFPEPPEGLTVFKNDRGYWERTLARTGEDFGR